MGQSATTANQPGPTPSCVPGLAIFPTNLGWFGLIGRERKLLAVLTGHASANEVRSAARRQLPDSTAAGRFREEDWAPELHRRLERFCLGERVEFNDVPLVLPAVTDFQRRVLNATRRIGYGETISYGELAEKAGAPRAARAVGTVMAGNRFPIVIPCHRVVASGGKPGGYSSPQGISLKLRLLALEAGTTH